MVPGTMGHELLLGVEAPVADVGPGAGELLTVPQVKAAGVLDCFVVTPFWIVVEGRTAGFGDCADVGGHDFFGLLLRHGDEESDGKTESNSAGVGVKEQGLLSIKA